jgi:plastocyanin
MGLRLTSLVATAALCLLSSVAAAQTTHVVNQVGLVFVPDTLTIAEGDTVQWVWSGGVHTVTSGVPCTPDGTFDMPLDAATPLASFTYNSAGTFDYYCIPHCLINMVGVITVTQPVPNLPGWSLLVMGVLLVMAGGLVIRRRLVAATA